MGEIVTKQPSLLALPVDAELFSRPAARYDVEVGPESSAYAEVAKALKMRRQLRRWESPQETEAAVRDCLTLSHDLSSPFLVYIYPCVCIYIYIHIYIL